MLEFNLEGTTAAQHSENFAVSVVGIGGSGSNVLDRIALEGMPAAELICLASDIRVLNNSMASQKLQLGAKLTQGLGAGGDPELGLEAAQASEGNIREMFKGKSMVFICMGLGGGTGSGAAPYVAKLAREAGAFVVVFATLPFSFEGRRRQKQANVALSDLRQHANALITFENDRMGELVVPKKGIQEAFQLADRVIGQSVRAVTSLVTQPGIIRIGMDDLMTALRNTDSRCLFGYGQAKGENRALEALTAALKSPLLDRGQLLAKASNVLVHVCGGQNMSLFEIQTLMGELNKHVGEDAHLLFGAAVDPKLGDHLSVTVLTSLAKEGGAAEQPTRFPAEIISQPIDKPFIEPLRSPVQSTATETPPPPHAHVIEPAMETPIPTPEEPKLRIIPKPPVAPIEETYEEEEVVGSKAVPPPAPVMEEEEEEEEEEELEEEEFAPPPARKFAIRDVLNQRATAKPHTPAAPVRSTAPYNPPPAVAPARPTALTKEQQTFDERLIGGNRGRFEKIEPTVEEGTDLDVPTFLRKKR